MTDSKTTIAGLSDEEVSQSRMQNGTNSLQHQEKNQLLISLLDIVKEPMFLLLVAAASIYFITGDYGDGIFMSLAIVLVTSISLYQE